MNGYEKLKAAVMYDVEKEGGIFSENGCNNCNKRCFHKYCDKFKWVIDRAKYYAEKVDVDWETILNKWEEDRSYWYMNYYQETSQPLLDENVRIFDTVEDFKKVTEGKGFRCPYCKGISTHPQVCNSGKLVKLMNQKGKHPCNWSAGGLLGTLGKGRMIFIKELLLAIEIFTPIVWEKNKKR